MASYAAATTIGRSPQSNPTVSLAFVIYSKNRMMQFSGWNVRLRPFLRLTSSRGQDPSYVASTSHCAAIFITISLPKNNDLIRFYLN